MKRIAMAIMLLTAMSLGAIMCLPGSGAVSTPKETTFAYHAGTDDYRFYGTSTWAVRFNFAAVYPSDPDSYFAANAAVLWLPQTGDSVKVELFTEAAGLPAQRLVSVSANVSSQIVVLPFPQTIQAEVVWMLVTYSTNFANRYISASAGDGTHSYYLNSNAENPYLQSFASAGFSAELLFGLRGDFVSTYTDLELLSLDFNGDLLPRELVYPSFSIYNHSTQSVSDASLSLQITSPIQEFSQTITIPVLEAIPPNSEYIWSTASQGYYQHGITLPDNPLLFKARGTVSAVSAVADTMSNNSITSYFQAFADSPPLYLVEDFVRNANAEDMIGQQESVSQPSIHRLIYYPDLSDTLSTPGSMEHFNWYLFNSLPRTVVGGDGRITGFSEGYTAQYQALATEMLDDKTFITDAECRFTNQSQDSMTAEVTLFNTNTHLFTSTAEYNLAANCRWFMGLFRAENITSQTSWVLQRWIAHAASISGNLTAGESSIQTQVISLGGLDLDNRQYRLYYWLQMNGGGKVFYINWADLNANVSAQDDVAEPARLDCRPNPLYSSGVLALSVNGGNREADGMIRVYNLRGQLLHKAQLSAGKARLSGSIFPASGVYIIRMELQRRDGSRGTESKRITVIK